MLRRLLLLSTPLAAAAGSIHGPSPTNRCSDVTLNLTATSQNLVFESPPDPADATASVAFIKSVWNGTLPATLGTAAVTGTFSIRGTYCTPSNPSPPGAADTLEILLHGITYDKAMWAGYGLGGGAYNWHAHAGARGYATLALDRLGHGASSKPDPLAGVQPAMHIETIRQIIAAARGDGSSPPALRAAFGGRRFARVVLVGHSYGSYLAPAVASLHPGVVDALVLTAYSTTFSFASLLAAQFGGAAVVDPTRFAGLPAGYVAQASAAERQAAFYAGGYDPAVAAADFARDDTLTTGEFGGFTALVGPAVAAFAGPVLVVSADRDGLTCQQPLAACEAILAKSHADAFPYVTDYTFFVPRNTGHDLTLHFSAPSTFARVHDWLDQRV